MAARNPDLPLVYSCSGCSSAAQTANQVALKLDRLGVAEMSCIAGVGGDVPHLVKIAKSGRPIVGIDGCVLACVKSCLSRHDIAPRWYLQLHEHGVKKRYHSDFEPEQVDAVTAQITQTLQSELSPASDTSAAT
ncbi:putative zinc-binding protein [Noviherbaspirillum sp. ST9]|uniref:putative zinc-binding protein n=1 Tax=Noviherbaspirillum sp. ST9 TaxID=3401606 RepID=UPI003B58604F